MRSTIRPRAGELGFIAIGAGAFAIIALGVVFLDDFALIVVSIAIVLFMALAIHGYAAVELVRLGYLRRAWREGYYY